MATFFDSREQFEKARRDWLNNEAAQGRAQDAGGQRTGEDGSKFQGAQPFSSYTDQNGKEVFHFNPTIASNQHQGTVADPLLYTEKIRNDRAKDMFAFQTDILGREAEKGRQAISNMGLMLANMNIFGTAVASKLA